MFTKSKNVVSQCSHIISTK